MQDGLDRGGDGVHFVKFTTGKGGG
jgi:hypothetical protein